MAGTMIDEEKGAPNTDITTQTHPSEEFSSSEDGKHAASPSIPASSGGFFAQLNEKITSIKYLEKRGIERVPEDQRHDISASGYLQMTLLWFSTNLTANNIAVGMLGPLSYDLGFTDSALCAAFGAVVGAGGAAYMSTFGPASGNRTMVSSRLTGTSRLQ
jgi:hypothetical protein